MRLDASAAAAANANSAGQQQDQENDDDDCEHVCLAVVFEWVGGSARGVLLLGVAGYPVYDVVKGVPGERLFERASDEPVLRLASVVLAPGAVGLILGALERASCWPASRCWWWSSSSPIALAVAAIPAGAADSRNATVTVLSNLAPPTVWQAFPVACQSRPRAHV